MTIEIVEWMQSFRGEFLDFFFNMISYLGEETIYMIVFAIIYYAVNKRMGEFLAFTLFFTGVLNTTLKNIVNAPRPFEKYPSRVENLRPQTSLGTSFPSGHTQNFTAFWFGFANYVKKNWLYVLASVLAILMALSRMYLGVHFFEDVMTSIVLGIVSAYLFYKYFERISTTKVYVVICVVFLPFVILFQAEDLFKTYGLVVGFTLAMYLEKKFINFTLDVSKWKKAIRVGVGLSLMLIAQMGGGVLFDLLGEEGTTWMHILDMLRYFLIAVIGLGLYPMLFKRFNF